MSYTVNLSAFEGPFDLLLHLVKVNEMDISDINIAEITDQYLKALRDMRQLDLEVAGDFLVMAATLINLKVRALLPELPSENTQDDEGEEISEIVSAKALMQQLVEYRKYKELSVDLGGRQEQQMRLFFRNTLFNAVEKAENDAPLRSDLGLLFHCFSRVLRYIENQSYHNVAYEPFSVEQRIGMLKERVKNADSMVLMDLFKDCRNKVDAIVTFLALLELSRLKLVRLEQNSSFDEVYIFRRDLASEAPPEGTGDEAAEISAPVYGVTAESTATKPEDTGEGARVIDFDSVAGTDGDPSSDDPEPQEDIETHD